MYSLMATNSDYWVLKVLIYLLIYYLLSFKTLNDSHRYSNLRARDPVAVWVLSKEEAEVTREKRK